MKKKYTAAVLIAAMFAVTQKLPMRFERAHAEGEDGSVGDRERRISRMIRGWKRLSAANPSI